MRGRLESVFDWATVRHLRRGENSVLAQPSGSTAADVDQVYKIEHHAALPFAGMLAFMEKLARQEGTGVRPPPFLILTAAQRGEVRGTRRCEIDVEPRLWSIWGARMNAGHDH